MTAPARPVSNVDGPVSGVVSVPGSKSLTNRALLTAALAAGRSRLRGMLRADDTDAMIDCLRRLGADVGDDGTVVGAGLGGRTTDLDARMSGTTSRFLLPVLAAVGGRHRLDGAPSLRARPFADQIDALTALGADITPLARPGRLPLLVEGHGLQGGTVDLAGSVSSQFASGMLLAAPLMERGLTLRLTGRVVSRSYLDMTCAVMTAFGASIERPDDRTWSVAGGGYRATDYAIEPDASAASYFFAAAAVTGGRVEVTGLGSGSPQGDMRFLDVLEAMGARVERDAGSTALVGCALHGVDVDMGDMSDTAQTLAVVAPFASSPSAVTGIGFIRGKETDRIGAVVTELRRCGVAADEEPDGFTIRPRPGAPSGPATIATYDDHRMAMSFAVLGLRTPGIRIADPGCVAKTFPDFWDTLDRLTAG